MFQRSAQVGLDARTVGVLERKEGKMMPGYTLVCCGQYQFLLDSDGRVCHEWCSQRNVFVAHLLDGGNLLRDGSENTDAPLFQAGGAAGFVEVVNWENELVWSWSTKDYSSQLTHHELEPMPNGNVLLLTWARKTKEACIKAGRRPELIPDGEVWDNLVVELRPDGKGSADVVWVWSVWDHLVQDYDPDRANYQADVGAHPELFDINFCPPGGKIGCRNRDSIADKSPAAAPSGFHFLRGPVGKQGEKDWLHCNCVSYDSTRDLIVISVNVMSEFIIIDHSTTTAQAAAHKGGKRGKGGDILYRFGNPQVRRRGSPYDQQLFCQHSAKVITGMPGEGHILLFNNGRAPDRHWSSVDEFALPESEPGIFRMAALSERVWSFGPAAGRLGSFYCTHSSGCARLPNGNTLVTMGPQGILFEVTPAGEEVWRWVNPVSSRGGAFSVTRQGEQRQGDGYSLFRAVRYAPDDPRLAGRALAPARYVEA